MGSEMDMPAIYTCIYTQKKMMLYSVFDSLCGCES